MQEKLISLNEDVLDGQFVIDTSLWWTGPNAVQDDCLSYADRPTAVSG